MFSGRGLCVRPITRPEGSYRMWRNWVWSWSLDNDEALAQQWLLRHGKKNYTCFLYNKTKLDAVISQIVFCNWNSTCFGQFLCPSSGVFSLYTQQWYMSHRFVDRFQAGSGWNWVPSWSCSKAVYKLVWHIPLLSVQWITPDDGQRNCPKHVEFHFPNKIWEISVSSLFYYKEICHDARSREGQIILAYLHSEVFSPKFNAVPQFGPHTPTTVTCHLWENKLCRISVLLLIRKN